MATLKSCLTMLWQFSALKKNWNITFNGISSPSSKYLVIGNQSQKSYFSSSHSRETTHKEPRFVDTEWMLQSKLFNLALEYFRFKPDRLIDNINRLIHRFVCHQNLYTIRQICKIQARFRVMYTDAFNIDWSDLKFYAFFSYFSHIQSSKFETRYCRGYYSSPILTNASLVPSHA